MGRSTGTVFFIAFVLGAVAFVVTLLVAPMPASDGPARLSDEELAEQRERQRELSIAMTSHRQDRTRFLIEGDWPGLARSARSVLERNPHELWANIDLMHAIDAGEGTPGELREQALALREYLQGSQARVQRWMVDAAEGWSAWFAGDETGARRAWRAAADYLGQREGNPNWAYNRAGYLSLAGDADGAIEAWENAVSLGFAYNGAVSAEDPYAYARADYDNRYLREDPRFEAIIARDQQLMAERRARELEDEERRVRAELEKLHAESHPPMPAGGSPGGGDDTAGP